MIIGLVTLVLLAAILGVTLWGLIDAATTPDAAWRAAGQNKVLWLVLQGVGFLVCGLGTILSIVYLAVIRPKLRRARGL